MTSWGEKVNSKYIRMLQIEVQCISHISVYENKYIVQAMYIMKKAEVQKKEEMLSVKVKLGKIGIPNAETMLCRVA